MQRMAANRRTYETPVLTRLGSVAALTLETSSGSRMDKGNDACTPTGGRRTGGGGAC